MSEEDLSPVESSDQGTALEAAQETAQWTTQTADPSWMFDSGMGKNYKTKTRIQEEEVKEDKTQQGGNHRDAGRKQALHVHPQLSISGKSWECHLQ